MRILTVGLNYIGYSEWLFHFNDDLYVEQRIRANHMEQFFSAYSLFTLKLCKVMNRYILFKYSRYLMKKRENLPIAKANSIWETKRDIFPSFLIND